MCPEKSASTATTCCRDERRPFCRRFEPETFRGGRLKIRAWWWEDGVKPAHALLRRVDACLVKFCAYLGAEGYEEFLL